MKHRPFVSLILSLAAGLWPLEPAWAGSGNNLPAIPRVQFARLVKAQMLNAEFLSGLPPLPAAGNEHVLSAEDWSKWAAVSLFAHPQSTVADPRLQAPTRSVQEFLKDKPELAGRLEEIRDDFVTGRLARAARGLDRIYDNNPFSGRPGEAVAAAAADKAPISRLKPAWTRGVFLPQTVDQPLPGDALGVTVHRLANGMTIYLSPNRQEPRVSYEIAVRAGSRHDPLEATGMAHYLEHMQFKGTGRLGTTDYAGEKPHLDRIERLYDKLFETADKDQRDKIHAAIDVESQAAARFAVPNELDKLYASAGFTDINAHTSYEETVYSGSFPANKAEVWARVEADRLADPVYRIFLPELETVYEEYNRGLDNPDGALYDAAFGALYKGHPYARAVKGLGEHLKNPSISRMRNFFSDHYRPNNMAVILSGDFDPKEMLRLIEGSFGKLAPAVIPPPPRGQVGPLKGVRRVEVLAQDEELAQVDWLLPGHNHPDEDALALAGQLLGNLLNVRLNTAQKVKWSGQYQHVLNEAGGWLIMASPKKGQTLEQTEKILLAEVKKLKAGDFSDGDLKTATAQMEVADKKRLEKNSRRTGLIRDSFITAQEWKDSAGTLERLKRLTRADILRVADRYLGEDRLVVYRRKGTPAAEKVAKPEFTSVPIDTSKQSPFFKEISSLPSKPLAPRFLKPDRDYKILNRSWGRLYWTDNPVNDLFNLEFRFDRGSAHEKRLYLALALLQVSGAGALGAEEFQKTLDRLGSTMETWCGEQECLVRLTGLEMNLKETLRLALLRFSKPNIAAGAFQRMIKVERGSRADRKLDLDGIHSALAQFAGRGKDSEYLKELTPRELNALAEDGLRGVLRSVFQYRRAALYTGNRPAHDVAAMLSAAQTRGRYRRPLAQPPVKLVVPRLARVLFVHREGLQQALIGVYAADGAYDPGARLDYNFYNAVMGGGMGGIYFQEIRESRALAYSAQGGYRPPARAGGDNTFWSYAGTQADKAVETARLMRELMKRPPITRERYALARRQVEESFRTEAPVLDRIPRSLLNWQRMGFDGDPRPQSFRKLGSYRPEKLDAFASRLQSKPLTFYIVGDRGSVNLDGLKELGVFEEVSVDDIFAY